MGGKPRKDPPTIRGSVLWFAAVMEIKLRENDHKGGWEDCGLGYLTNRLWEEWEEARGAMGDLVAYRMAGSDQEILESAQKAILELADVANFAMMLAERCGKLGGTDK